MKQGATEGTVTQEFKPSELFKDGFFLESIELILGGPPLEVIGKVAIFLMGSYATEEGESIFSSGATIILPPMAASKINESAVREAIIAAFKVVCGYSPDDKKQAFLKRLFRVIHCTTLDAEDLVDLVLRESAGRRLVAIADGSKYRDAKVSLPTPVGISSVQAQEDQWVPHVAGLCQRCVAAVRQTKSYAFIHVDEIPPQNPELEAMLVAVDGCYPCYLRYQVDLEEEIVARRAQVWTSWVLSGKSNEAVSEIQDLDISECSRLHLMLQLMYRCDRREEALALVQHLQPYLENFPKGKIVQIARIAYICGNSTTALQMLPRDLVGLGEEVWVEAGLDIATDLENDELIECYYTQLVTLFPNSERLRENCELRLFLNCQAASGHRRHVFTTVGFSVRHLEILGAFTMPAPKYEEIIEKAEKWGCEWVKLVIICCAIHAKAVDKNLDAINAACLIPSSSLYWRQAIQIILLATRAMMLEGSLPQEKREYYRIPIMAVISFLASHPRDKQTRASFSRLLSVEACGEIGLVSLAATMLNLAETSFDEISGESQCDSIAREEDADTNADVQAALMRCMEWVGEQGYGEFGITKIPQEIIGGYADQVIKLLSCMMPYAEKIERQDTELSTMNHMALVASALQPYASKEKDEDLRILRSLAGHHAHAGYFQHARNIAEQILDIGQDSGIRHRLAWFAYADVYQRCKNPIDALVGLACTFATNVTAKKEDLLREVYTVIRVLRDLKMTELASMFLPVMKKLVEDLGSDPKSDLFTLSIELGLRFTEIYQLDDQGVQTLVDDVAKACGQINDKSDVLPWAVLLGQIVRASDERSITVPIDVRRLLMALIERLGPHEAELVRTTSALLPTTHQIVSMCNNIERAMFGEDAVTDLETVSMAARRLLATPEAVTDWNKAITLAVEVLADQSITLLSSLPEVTEEWALQYAQKLNDEGVDVAFMALNDCNELLVTVVSNGKAAAIRQPPREKSFYARMQVWLEEYPKGYGLIDSYDGGNEFFRSMDALGVCLPMSEKLIIVAEPFLQQLTANLIVVHPEDDSFDYFYGSQSAVGVVPSLRWLSVARARLRAEKQEYRAWISADPGLEADSTLDIALARLSGTFEDFGFVVDTDRQLPSGMSDASLAVVVAHGGLAQEGRYLQRIRDEEKLIESPAALAESLAGVEVVILFICNGGRIDKHPWGNRTVSLPRQLLNKGVQTVIASPWPLDVKVTYNWLDPFIKAWNDGDTALKATKLANDFVASRLGNIPQYSLAMGVYGDVLITK